MDIDDEGDVLLLNVFPERELQSVPIVGDNTSLLVMHQKIQQSLVYANTELGYSVQVISRDTYERMRSELKFDPMYVESKVSNALQAKLNETRIDGVERFFPIEKKLRKKTIVVIMPMPRDVARLYYPIPGELFASLSYTIRVYDGQDAVLKMRILEYMERTITQNNELFSPLEMILPVQPEDINDPLMVVFVAILDDGDVVGCCGSKVLRYRAEIRDTLDKTMQSLEDVKERYFMNVSLSHSYEIKGLSVDQTKGGMHIALMLLYCAMDFIRQPRVREIYTVSHVATQSASYITKRLLVTSSKFHFAYHGMNEFMNESFFETLAEEKKTLFMRVMTEYIGYYTLLITKRAETLTNMLRKKVDLKITDSPYLTVIRDAICIYQLYYLLLVTSQRKGAPNCFNTNMLNSVIGLFTLFISTLTLDQKVFKPLRDYLERNIVALRAYHKTQKIEVFDDAVYTKGFDKATGVQHYGFLKKPAMGEKKTVIMSAYEFIYTSIANTVELMQILITMHSTTPPLLIEIDDDDDDDAIVTNTEIPEMREYLTRILGLTNALVEGDLVQEINYEIPLSQLDTTRVKIKTLVDTLKKTVFADDVASRSTEQEEPRRATLNEILKSVVKKIAFLQRNYAISAIITNNVFNINPKESSGFDTFISFERLSQHWPQIESDVLKRIGYTTMVMLKEGDDDDDDDMAMAVEEVPTLEIPDSAEKRREILHNLYQLLLVHNPPKESDVFFGERVWPVAYLTAYFRDLSVIEDVSSLTETQKTDGDEATTTTTTTTTFAYVYKYENFSRLLELQDESRFNTGGFI